MHHNTSGQRDEWKFSYKGISILKAALAKKKYHQQRLIWWSKKKDEIVASIRKSGIEVNETIVDELRKQGYSTANNAINTFRASGGTVRVKEELLVKLNECIGKVDSHTSLVREYDGWAQAFADAKDSSFDLVIGDWLFFFGK